MGVPHTPLHELHARLRPRVPTTPWSQRTDPSVSPGKHRGSYCYMINVGRVMVRLWRRAGADLDSTPTHCIDPLIEGEDWMVAGRVLQARCALGGAGRATPLGQAVPGGRGSGRRVADAAMPWRLSPGQGSAGTHAGSMAKSWPILSGLGRARRRLRQQAGQPGRDARGAPLRPAAWPHETRPQRSLPGRAARRQECADSGRSTMAGCSGNSWSRRPSLARLP